MKRSYSPSQVKSRFENLLSSHRSAVLQFETASRDVSMQKTPIRNIYTDLLDQFVTALASGGQRADFAAIHQAYGGLYDRLIDESSASSKKLDDLLLAESGGIRLNDKNMDDIKASGARCAQDKSLTEKQYIDTTAKLLPVSGFNADAKARHKPQLSEDTLAYFSSKTGVSGFFARMFDGHYKTGRKIIRAFEKNSLSITDLQSEALLLQGRMQKLQQEKSALDAAETELRAFRSRKTELEAGIFTADKVALQVKNAVIKDMQDDIVFSTMTQKFKDIVPSFLIESRAKVAALNKIEQRAEEQARSLKSMTKKIDEAMPKLRKAAGNYRARNIDIDLDGIEESFKKLHARAETDARQIKNINKAVGIYKPSAYDDRRPVQVTIDTSWTPLDIYMNIMLYDMLMDHQAFDVDMGAINSMFDIPSSVADDINLNFDGFGSGLDFNDRGPDIADGLTNVFNTDFDNFSIPDVPVPDISFDMPDISFDTGFDSGGFDSGGFDGGGGFD